MNLYGKKQSKNRLEKQILKIKQRWIGHTLRKLVNIITRQAMEMKWTLKEKERKDGQRKPGGESKVKKWSKSGLYQLNQPIRGNNNRQKATEDRNHHWPMLHWERRFEVCMLPH